MKGNMGEKLKRVPWGLVTFLANAGVAALIYMHTMSVNAAVDEKLKAYVTKEQSSKIEKTQQEQFEAREKARLELAAEFTKRVDGRLEDVVKRLERIENKL